MGKSIIPFIFENHCLNKIFIEAACIKNASKVFEFLDANLEDLKSNKYIVALTDYSSFKKIQNLNLSVNKIFVISDSNIRSNSFNNEMEVIKLTIPFKLSDIYQRIENNLIQVNNNKKRLMKYKNFTYDPSTRILSDKSHSLRFTEKEGQILICLLENTSTHISKKDLLIKVWSYGDGIDTHTLETHVYALRKKIEKKLMMTDLIMFEEKKGYYLNKSIL